MKVSEISSAPHLKKKVELAKDYAGDQGYGVASIQETTKNTRTLQPGKEMTDVKQTSKLWMT